MNGWGTRTEKARRSDSGLPNLFATIPRMPIEQIVQQLRAERDRLDAAIKALTGVSGAAPARPSGGRNKTMSAAARRRISIAQKARWAKVKAGKNRSYFSGILKACRSSK